MNDNISLKEQVDLFAKRQAWNHNFILSDGTETRPGNFSSPAKNANKLKRIDPILSALDINGKTILDLGCNEGFFSIELAKRGAKLIGVDADYDRIEKAKFIKEIIANDLSIRYECKNFLTDDDNLEPADIILCLGFLHRVPDPITVIEKLSKLNGTIIFEWKAEYSSSPKNPSAVFSSQSINKIDKFGTEYWLLSIDALRNILKRYGFDFTYLVENKAGKREILVASRNEIKNLKVQNESYRRIRGFLRLLKETIKAGFNIFKDI